MLCSIYGIYWWILLYCEPLQEKDKLAGNIPCKWPWFDALDDLIGGSPKQSRIGSARKQARFLCSPPPARPLSAVHTPYFGGVENVSIFLPAVAVFTLVSCPVLAHNCCSFVLCVLISKDNLIYVLDFYLFYPGFWGSLIGLFLLMNFSSGSHACSLHWLWIRNPSCQLDGWLQTWILSYQQTWVIWRC